MNIASDLAVKVDIVCLSINATVWSVSALTMWRLRQRFSTYLAVAFCGVALEGSIAGFSVSFLSPAPVLGTNWYVISLIFGRFIEMVAGIIFLGYFYHFFNGIDSRKEVGAGIGS